MDDAGLLLADSSALAKQLVTAIEAGHVVLQGPPGTGKTTVARILAEVYSADLRVTTSTADWSTYDVIGGLRPVDDGSFAPALGVVSEAVLACAESVNTGAKKATWLLIDEFNRADIDKAIGPLYTVLSSNAPSHLLETPLELWFERSGRKELWVPTAFRIIATMNDVDASYVNSLSQGLSRRFQFVSIGVAVDETAVIAESEAALSMARQRWSEVTGLSAVPGTPAIVTVLANVLHAVRNPGGKVQWPLGTAQIVDVWFSLLVQSDGDLSAVDLEALDICFADTVTHQASNLSLNALKEMADVLRDYELSASERAVRHLADASSTRF